MAGKQDDKSKQWQQYQAAQMGVANSMAQRQQNFAAARAQTMADLQQNATLYQAGQVMANAQLNPATQRTLGKYGVQKPQTFSQTSRQQAGPTTIINNTTTTNNYGGPVQGRGLAFTQGNEAVSKFKVWLENAFASQNATAARRSKEYEKRERSLMKDTNKLSRKLEELGKTIGEKMDPRRIGSTVSSQLKTLLFLFGFGTMAKNWSSILNMADGILTFFTGKKLNRQSGEVREGGGNGNTPFENRIVSIFGGRPGETLGQALKGFLFDTDPDSLGLFTYFKDTLAEFFKVRGDAIKLIKQPAWVRVTNPKFPGQIATWLGQVLSVFLTGSEGLKSNLAADMLSGTAFKDTGFDKSGSLNVSNANPTSELKKSRNIGWEGEDEGERNNTSIGAARLLTDYKSETINYTHDLDDNGNLKSVDASILQSNQISRMIQDKSTVIHPAEMMSGLNRLKNFKGGNAVVSADFIESLAEFTGYSPVYVKDKIRSAGGYLETYGFLRRKKTKAELAADDRGKSEEYTIEIKPTSELNKDNISEALGERLLSEKEIHYLEDKENPNPSVTPNNATPGVKMHNSRYSRQGVYDDMATRQYWKLTPEAFKELEKLLSVNEISTENFDDIESTLTQNWKNFKIHHQKTGTIYNPDHGDYEDGYEDIVFSQDNIKTVDITEDLKNIRSVAVAENMLGLHRKENWGNTRAAQGAASKIHRKGFRGNYEVIQSETLKDYIDNATKFIRLNARGENNYGGWCARGVSEALHHAGMPYPGVNARDYYDWATKHGYTALRLDDKYSPQAGDIDWQVGPRGEQHVSMYDGHDWISDTIQNTRKGLEARYANTHYQALGHNGKLEEYILRPGNEVLNFVKGYTDDQYVKDEEKAKDEQPLSASNYAYTDEDALEDIAYGKEQMSNSEQFSYQSSPSYTSVPDSTPSAEAPSSVEPEPSVSNSLPPEISKATVEKTQMAAFSPAVIPTPGFTFEAQKRMRESIAKMEEQKAEERRNSTIENGFEGMLNIGGTIIGLLSSVDETGKKNLGVQTASFEYDRLKDEGNNKGRSSSYEY